MGMRLLQETTGVCVWLVGPLFAIVGRREPMIGVETIAEWLGFQLLASVLYVSFGSQYTLSLSQTVALVEGLAVSSVRLIWVIRPPMGFDLSDGSGGEWLPLSFREWMRQRNQGLVVRDWVLQLEILSHPSTGGFLSHCGWNSSLESLN